MEEGKKPYDFLSRIFKNKGKKKMVENAVILIIIGIIIVIAGGSFLSSGKKTQAEGAAKQEESVKASVKGLLPDAAAYEKELESILTKIKGVGKVNVMVTYVSTSEVVPAFETEKSENGTEEKDSGGGTRAINQSSYKDNIVYEELPGGGKKPVVVKEKLPEVKGVVVAADGASDPIVRENVCKAVQALLDVPMHRIQVFEREG